MNLKKIVCTAILMAALSTLLVNQASAHQIIVFAAPNYPANPWISGSFVINGWANTPDADGYTANDHAPINSALPGEAVPWVCTPLTLCTWANQTGSVHADAWAGYILTGAAGIKVQLRHEQWSFTPLTYRYWEKWWWDAIPTTWRTNTVDLGINYYDLSVYNWPGPQNPLHFQWTNGFFYRTIVRIWATAAANSMAFIEIAKFDDILWMTYVTSPGKYEVQSPSDPQIELSPPAGPVKAQVNVTGTGFAPEATVYIYFDETQVNKTISNPDGTFKSQFSVPDPSAKGPHVVRAIDALENTAYDFFDIFIEAPPIPRGDLNGDGRVNILDAIMLAANWGKTDPNVDPPEKAGAPPEKASATDISTSMSTIALIATVSIGLFRLCKKTKIDDKTNTT